MTESTVQVVAGADLSAAQLYEIWRIRDQVFMVEQACTETDVDDVDLRSDCVHAWIVADDGRLRTYARAFAVGDTLRIGRVATREEDRNRGLAGLVLDRLLSLANGRDVTLHAQAHLADWYASRGFEVNGPEFEEAGIPHLPMLLRGSYS